MRLHWWNRVRHLGRWRKAALAGMIAAYLLSVLFFLVTPGAYRHASAWGAFATVETEIDPVTAETLLGEAGLQTVITAHTSDVLVTRFSGVEKVPLSAALDQLDPLDPRRDAYITGLSRYFQVEPAGRSLVYVETMHSLRRTSRLVRRVLGSGSRVVDYRPGGILAGLVIFAAAAATAVVLTRGFRLAVVAAVVPLAASVFGAGIPGAVAVSLLLLVWCHALGDVDAALGLAKPERDVSPALLRAGIWVGALAAVSWAVTWAMSGITAALALLPATAGLVAVTVVVYLLKLGGSVHRDHDLFAPVSILSGRVRASAGLSVKARPALVLAVAIGLLAVPLVADRIVSSGHAPVPRPQPARGGEDISFHSVAALWLQDDPESLVDVSDYLAHRAYQQSLAYGRGFAPPVEDETVTLSRYRENETGAYTRFPETVMSFDSAWLAEALRDVPRGVTAMIIATGRASGVVLTPERGLYSGYPQVLIHIAYVLLALSPAALSGRRVPQLGRNRSKVVEIARRRKQVA